MQKLTITPLRPTKLMKETILIKTPRIGFIPQLGMQGPIVTPVRVTREVAKSLVVAGIKTSEVYKDRNGKLQVRELTLQNVYPGEGEPDPEPDENEGEQKPTVPTSGVVQQEPVEPVTLQGVSIPEEKVKETTEEKTEETKEETPVVEEKKEDSKQQNNNKKKHNKK